MKCELIVAATVLSALNLGATTYSGGSGDLASADFWGGEMPAPGEAISFTAAAGNTYTLSKDAEFGAVSIQRSANFDLASSGSHKLTVDSFNTSWNGAKINFIGGVWDVVGNFFVSTQSGGGNSCEIKLSSGCKLSVGGTPRVSHKSEKMALRITDGSSMTVKNNMLVGVNASQGNVLEISSGGTLTFLSGRLMTDTPASSASEASSSNRVIISGAGSKLNAVSCTDNMSIGNTYAGNDMLVSDGGELDLGKKSLLIGNGIYSTDNLVTVTAGGTVKADQVMLVYPRNRLVVDNANVTCSQVTVGAVESSVGCSVLVKGADAVYSTVTTKTSRYPVFGFGSDHRFTLDGATWSLDYNIALDNKAQRCVFQMVNGAVLNLGGGVFFGTNDVLSAYNTMEVLSGSTVNAAFVSLTRHDNKLVVSNGTVKASAATVSNSGIGIGRKLLNVDPESVAGNSCVLQGDRPLLDSARAIEVINGSTLRFEIPESGYAENHVPVCAKLFTLDASSSLEVLGVAKMQQAITDGHRKTVTLIRADSGLSVPDAALAAANARLQSDGCRNCRLSVNAARTELTLKVPAMDGMLMILR